MPNTLVLTDPTARRDDAVDVRRADDVELTSSPAGGSHSHTVENGGMDPVEASAMATSETLIRPAVDESTERFDSIACLDERVRHVGRRTESAEPGHYIQIQGSDRTLLIALDADVIHIGRGLAADLHLDDSSVSRRHAVLVPRASGYRILDDRSSNGTFVNGRRIEQVDLRNGDVIVLGRVVLRYLEVKRDQD